MYTIKTTIYLIKRNVQLKHSAIRCLVFLLSATVVSSCASLSVEECQYQNWRVKGVMDGSVGKPARQVQKYQRDCSKYGITINSNEYELGRVEGLEAYCTTQSGYQVGINGGVYEQACVATNEQLFLTGYLPARKLYVAHRDYETAKRTVNSSEYEVNDLERRIERLLAELRREVSDERRVEINKEIRDLERRITDAMTDQRQATYNMPILQQECQNALNQLRSRGFNSPYSCY